MGENKNDNSSMSLSKQRKLDRKKEIAQAKRNKLIGRIVSICILVALVAGIGSLIVYKIYRNATKVTPSSNYSLGLEDNGFIKDVTATDYVTLPEIDDINVPADEVAYTDDDLAKDIKNLVDAKATLDKETDAAIVDGNVVNIDFEGKIDGESFEGGSSNSQGYDLTIGSKSMIDDFEEQLIGHKIGDKFTIEATFPDEYEQKPALAGKTANFDVTVNGIYVSPEFDDEFVKTNYSDIATTAEEYKQYLKDTNSSENLTNWLTKYVIDNSTVSSYPADYMKALKQIKKYSDLNIYEYMNNMYQQNFGAVAYNSFSAYVKQTYGKKNEAAYDRDLGTIVEPMAKENLVYQAILEKQNVTISEDDYLKYSAKDGKTEEDFNKDIETYGKGSLLQDTVKTKAIEILRVNASIN